MRSRNLLSAVVLDDYDRIAIDIADWSRLADRVLIESLAVHLDGEELVRSLLDRDIVIAIRERTAFSRSLLERLPRLKLLVTAGPINRAIDLDAAAELGIAVCGTRSVSDTAAEMTMGLMLSICRGIHIGHMQLTQSTEWKPFLGDDLAGKRLGIIGLGRIGAKVAELARAFGMQVAAWSENLTDEKCAAAGVTRSETLARLLSSSDIVTLHLALSPRTTGLLGADELTQMKKDAFLVNTSRGPIIDEKALLSTLERGHLAGAALDVFEREPLPPDHPLRKAPRVLLTPHIGFVTRRNFTTYFEDMVESIEAWIAGTPIRSLHGDAGSPHEFRR